MIDGASAAADAKLAVTKAVAKTASTAKRTAAKKAMTSKMPAKKAPTKKAPHEGVAMSTPVVKFESGAELKA
ncbi:hypothetical protein [Paraburkholderia fungorum]|uniref:hypothetical protein n=1 Tax=Paraburkholderia fungorum TaxID=134537 RepID=UPI003857F3FC